MKNRLLGQDWACGEHHAHHLIKIWMSIGGGGKASTSMHFTSLDRFYQVLKRNETKWALIVVP